MILEVVSVNLYPRTTFLHPLRSSSAVPSDKTLHIANPSALRDNSRLGEQPAWQLVYGLPPPHAIRHELAPVDATLSAENPRFNVRDEIHKAVAARIGRKVKRSRGEGLPGDVRRPVMQFGICVMADIDEVGFFNHAESLGYDSVWVTDSQMIFSDCYAPCWPWPHGRHAGSAWGRARPSAARGSLPCTWRRWRR